MIRIRQANEQDSQQWDHFIDQYQWGYYYHLWGWREVIKSSYKHQDYYLIYEEGSRIKGVFPSFILRAFGSPRIVSLPFCNYGGILTEDKKIEQAITGHLKRLMAKESISSLEIRSFNSDHISRGNYVTSILKLNSLDLLWSNFKDKLRNQIRKSEKVGLEFDGGIKYLEKFYQVYLRNMYRLGTPQHSLQFFKNLFTVFPKETRLFVVTNRKQVIAGMILFCYHREIADPWAASDFSFRAFNPNNFLYWQVIKWAVQQGFGSFDLGRSTIDSGVHHFKKQWGAVTFSLDYQRINPKNQPSKDLKENRILPKIWQKLPFFVVKNIGPLMRRYLE